MLTATLNFIISLKRIFSELKRILYTFIYIVWEYRDLYITFKQYAKRVNKNIYYFKNQAEIVMVPCNVNKEI